MPFAGGILQHGYQCGMLWGSSLAAGAEAYRRFGAGPEAESRTIEASRALVEAFRPRHDEIDCYEITHLNRESSSWDQFKFFMLKGGTIGCFKMASWFAPLAKKAIEEAFDSDTLEAASPGTSDQPGPATDSFAADGSPSAPVSCAALLARKMGASEQHATMVSGLAGGLGLCGGACGALGAAIWLKTMEIAETEDLKMDLKDPRIQTVIDEFLKVSDYEFECSNIVGKEFETVDDHARYVRDGGCGAMIEALAANRGETAES